MNRWTDEPAYRKVYVLAATLELAGPLSVGSGMTDESSDQPLSRDGLGRVLIPGTSLLGVLRADLLPPGATKEQKQAVTKLFGPLLGETPGLDAPVTDRDRRDEERGHIAELWTDDLPLREEKPALLVRDHVRLDNKTLVADPGAKYDRQLLQRGSFPLRLQWRPSAPTDEQKQVLLRVLQKLAQGIALGGRTRRGLGQMKPVERFGLRVFELQTPKDLAAWIKNEQPQQTLTLAQVADKLGVPLPEAPKTGHFNLELTLRVQSSLTVREQGQAVPGSSLAGVLRHQVRRIGFLLQGGETKVKELETWLFGTDPQQRQPEAGQVFVGESQVTGGKRLSHTRVAIDPWTGGASDHLLFETEATYQGELKLILRVKDEHKAALGLLLLALRDLWEGRLPVGGEVGIGRGRLLGKEGTLNGEPLRFNPDGVLQGGPAQCEAWVKAAVKHLGGPSNA